MISTSQKKHEWPITLPSLCWLFLFFLIPTFFVFVIAFRPHDYYGGITDGWTYENLYSLFSPGSLTIIWRTVWISSVATLITIGLSLPVGFYLSRKKARVRNLLILTIILPFWTSFLVRIFAWKTLLHPEGFFVQILNFLPFVSMDTPLLYNHSAVIFIMVYTYLPFAILPIYAAASKFDYSLFEAAMDLGAKKHEAFFKVFIPSIGKGIFNATMIVFVPILGSYVIPDVVGGPNSEMIGNRIGQKILVARNLPEASAWSTLLIAGILIPVSIGFWLHSRSKRITAEMRNKE